MSNYIRYIANFVSDKYDRDTFKGFMRWWKQQHSYQLDIETDVTDWWNTRKLISLQFGTTSLQGIRQQWFIQWSALTPEEQQEMIDEFNQDKREKLVHNGRYEYIVLRFYGIILENIYDTTNAEKVINGGMATADYALADISWKYLRIIMNKELQMAFGDDIITDPKILYGCTDVMYLDIIKRQQIEQADTLGLMNVLGLEMEVLQAFSDITYEGMYLNKEKWRENQILAEPIVDASYKLMNSWLNVEPFKTYALAKKIVWPEDRIEINFGSWQQKEELLKILFPDIRGSAKVVLQKYIRDRGMELSVNDLNILVACQEKDYQPMTDKLLQYHRNYLIKNNYLIPANQPVINWNSSDQALPIMQLVEHKLKGLSEEEINETSHPILRDLQAYRKALKLISSFGEEFIRKYVGPDGLVRANFNQIIDTGRCSCSNPNLQQMVVGDRVANDADPSGLRYRNSFYCEPGWSFVDGDYVSQELVIIAYMSKDPVWMECIEKGWDLHSVCAELIYKDKWKKAAQDDCAYYKMIVGPDGILVQNKQKCKCRGHKSLRDSIKPINFGLAYGMTKFKLAGELRITVSQAAKLIEEYFEAFPKIGKTLDFLGVFGVENGWVPTLSPFKRKRFFSYWRELKPYIEPYLMGIYNVPKLGDIERASKNHPIQGTSADIVKVAMVLVRNYIRDNNLWNKVRLKAQVHDQITTIAIDEFAEEWKHILNTLMWEAGNLVIPTGILKAEVAISPVWTK